MARAIPLLAILALLVGALPARAESMVTEQTTLVARAVNAVEELRSQPNLQKAITSRLIHARAVLIVPNMYKGGFLVGGAYGVGILLTRDARGGWSGPAFYSVTSASFGLQAGLEDSSDILVVMTESGLSAIMHNRLKLGVGAGVAVATIGAHAGAATTTNGGADIYAFATSFGAYGGASLEGSVIEPKPAWNAAYYGGHPSPRQILIARTVNNPQANALRDALAE